MWILWLCCGYNIASSLKNSLQTNSYWNVYTLTLEQLSLTDLWSASQWCPKDFGFSPKYLLLASHHWCYQMECNTEYVIEPTWSILTYMPFAIWPGTNSTGISEVITAIKLRNLSSILFLYFVLCQKLKIWCNWTIRVNIE